MDKSALKNTIFMILGIDNSLKSNKSKRFVQIKKKQYFR